MEEDFINVKIIYQGVLTCISCNINEKMEDIFNKFISKNNLNKESEFLIFLFNGQEVKKDLKLKEIVNKKEDIDNIIILASNMVNENISDCKSDIIVNQNYYDNNNTHEIDYYKQPNNINVEFIFNTMKCIIQCNLDDTIKKIIDKFCLKVNEHPNTLGFIYNGNKVDMNLKLKEVINKYDNKIQIIVYKTIDENEINDQLINLKENDNICSIIKDKIKKYNDDHKEKNFEQLPNYIFKKENNLDYKSDCLQLDIDEKKIPIIKINEKEYANFLKLLPYFREYSKFKNNKILNTKFICPNQKIEHINKKENIFFSECCFNSYSTNEYLNYENQIKEELKGENIDIFNYIEEWVRCIFNIMADYILFILYKKPLYYVCNKCYLPILYIQKNEKKNSNINIKNDNNSNQIISIDNFRNDKNSNQIISIDNFSNDKNLNNQIVNYSQNEAIINLILQYISILFGNSIIQLIDFNSKICEQYNKIINRIINKNNQNTNFSIGNPPKKKNYKSNENPPKKKDEKNIIEIPSKNNAINIVYYDENIKRNVSNVFDDSILFERVISNGIFILATDEKRFNLILEEIQQYNNENYNFHLIVTGSKCTKVMEILGEDKKKLFQDGCIYTGNYTKYKKYIKEYNEIIKNVYTEKDEIISFIINNENSETTAFQSYKLVNYDNYIDKYYHFHKLISDMYKEDILNDNCNLYFEAFITDLKKEPNKIKTQSDLDCLVSILEMLNNEQIPKKIREKSINEYTQDTIYKDLNFWLNELNILSYRKISFFIASLIYGINELDNTNKLKKNETLLYRGLKMSYINLSFYERNQNKVITLPSFTSCSTNKEIGEIFSGRRKYCQDNYKSYYYSLEDRKKNKLFSVLITINYNYKKEWEPNAISIKTLSEYKNENEYIFPPFSFFKIIKIDIDFENYMADITLESIGKKAILEKVIQEDKIILYNEKDKIMEEKNQKNYSFDINTIMKKEYPWFNFDINLNDEEEGENTTQMTQI